MKPTTWFIIKAKSRVVVSRAGVVGREQGVGSYCLVGVAFQCRMMIFLGMESEDGCIQ